MGSYARIKGLHPSHPSSDISLWYIEVEAHAYDSHSLQISTHAWTVHHIANAMV